MLNAVTVTDLVDGLALTMLNDLFDVRLSLLCYWAFLHQPGSGILAYCFPFLRLCPSLVTKFKKLLLLIFWNSLRRISIPSPLSILWISTRKPSVLGFFFFWMGDCFWSSLFQLLVCISFNFLYRSDVRLSSLCMWSCLEHPPIILCSSVLSVVLSLFSSLFFFFFWVFFVLNVFMA